MEVLPGTKPTCRLSADTGQRQVLLLGGRSAVQKGDTMSGKITISYKLSEAGRKKSLLAGGDGKAEQTIIADITNELLERAHVDSNGNATWGIVYNPARFQILPTYGRPEVTTKGVTVVSFDEPQTVESLLAWVTGQETEMASEKAALEAKLPERIVEWEKKQAEEAAERTKRETAKATEEAAQKAEKEARETERQDWIAEHGSDYLQRAVKLGYNCQRQYVSERATLELPGYELDFDDRAHWNSRSCPSPEALNEVERLIEAGHNAEVVWLTVPVTTTEDEDGYPEPFDPCEAIVVREYLSKYDLVKML